VAAVFDAFTRLYRFRVADLLRLASNGSGILSEGAIPPDLVVRLSDEACEIANKLMLICIRALDYCPPVDLTFGDYLRALVTADVEHSPEDEDGLRFALLESFRSWGIIPNDVNNYSVEALMWKPLEECFDDKVQVMNLKSAIQFVFNPDISKDYNVSRKSNTDLSTVVRSMEKILREENREKIFNESRNLSAHVHNMFDRKFEYFRENMEQLIGMNFKNINYSFHDDNFNKTIELTAPARTVFQVYKCRPIIRHNNQDGVSSKLLIITFLQKVFVGLKDSPYQGYLPDDRYELRGGGTLIIDLATYEIKYVILKNIANSTRLKDQLEYALNNLYDGDNAALLMQGTEPFAALHLH
jgi:hypothetical protein